MGAAVIVAGAGAIIAQSGVQIAARTGLAETLVGGLFVALTASLPELVTTLSAVRRGALTLAVSAVIGGNCYDVLTVALTDVVYQRGLVYHAIDSNTLFIVALTLLLTGLLLLGLLRREERGLGNIGFEGVLMLTVYLGAFALVALLH